MFNALLFVQQDANAQALEQLVIEFGHISIQRVFCNIIPSFELTIQLNTWSPDLIFLDLSDWDYAVELAAAFRAGHPEIPVIGFGAGWADEIRIRCAEAGITNILTAPVTMKVLEECVHRAIHGPGVPVQDNLVAFLPAKAGNGCTTVALNAAGCLANSLGKKVLLIEGDLNSGVLSVLLKTTAHHSLLDALEKSDHLDYSIWANCVVKTHGIDVVLAERSKPFPSWSNYLHLLQFIKSQYDLIIVDLPEVVNDATEEIVRRAKYVFTVCTPETTSLKLAQRRCRELEGRGISAERVGIIVNRWHDRDITEAEIEDRLEHGVAAIFPNDYASVQAAVEQGGMVGPNTKLGKTFLAFAKILAGIPEPFVPIKSRFEFLRNFRNRSPFKTPAPSLR
jgi:MinD-like ATPase involved in chromosome partitioning or flagellar assembly/CheY-like chemotaxis protein